tara:strand:- start:255 stop:2138 length:1884 start_codon:yes stop_codon:yes gene_type:complete
MNSTKLVKEFIDKQNSLTTLKFITCGSVDDGKSTLLGRLLYEAQLIFDDQVDSLVLDSKKIGTQGEEIDFALLVDGLAAEREQGITIDVAYRFFSTDERKFIVADSPGHEQYTRNMITAASNADLAIILLDARKGVLEQTKRHSFIANMVGIKNIIVAINKMDLIKYDEEKYKSIVENYKETVARNLDFQSIDFIPISALNGDNITKNSTNIDWYESHSIMELLEQANVSKKKKNTFCMSVQNVLRPNLDFRGFSGQVSSGKLSIGDTVFVGKTTQKAQVKSIVLGFDNKKVCHEGNSVTLCLDKEIDISRGDLITTDPSYLDNGNIFDANIIWFNEAKCYKNRSYLLKIGTKVVNAKIEKFKYKIDINSYKEVVCSSLSMNEIARCEVRVDEDIDFKPYFEERAIGSFILIDKQTNLTVGAGTINHSLRKSSNVIWEKHDIERSDRNLMLGYVSKVLFFTGLSGSGKSTLSNCLEKELFSRNILTYSLDGDNLRHGLNKDLGFSDEDRIENLRRVGELSKILYDSGVYVLASFISPFAKDRSNIKELFRDEDFIEIYVKCDIDSLKKRDPKGLYKKALSGEIPNFTGINSPYEEPQNPDLVVDTAKLNVEESLKIIIDYLKEKHAI